MRGPLPGVGVPVGVQDALYPLVVGVSGGSLPGAGKLMPTGGTPGAQRGCLLPGCSVSCRGARVVGCPVGMPGGGVSGAEEAEWRPARCQAGVRGARRRGCGGPGRGAVLTAALEALPAAAPDEVPAEIAPGVQPAAPRLEAVPGARCRRQPRVGMRPGAGPAGRADAQRVGSFQAAPARPWLRLQLPQLDELHGPAAAGAARRRGGGRHRAGAGAGIGRGRPDRAPRGN